MTKSYSLRLVKSGPPNVTVFVLGTQGSGKTTLLANLADEKERFIIFDTKDDFPPDFFRNGTPVVVADAQSMVNALNMGQPRIVVRLTLAVDQEEVMEDCLANVMRFQALNPTVEQWVVIDELNHFCHVNHCGDNLRAIMQRGRSIGIRKLFGAQWFGTVPTWARDGFSELWIFRHTDPAGLERLSELGFDSDIVFNLPQYHAHRLRGGEFETLKLAATGTLQTETQTES